MSSNIIYSEIIANLSSEELRQVYTASAIFTVENTPKMMEARKIIMDFHFNHLPPDGKSVEKSMEEIYTALLTAALSGSVLRGALCMVLFGVGSGVWLVAGPILWRSFRARVNRVASSWGSRLAGVVLFAMGGTALWMDVVHGQPAPWCLP